MNLDVIIPWGGALDDPWRTRAFSWVRDRYHALLPDAMLLIGTSAQDPFNRSEARNNAFAQSDADVVLVADADTVFQPDAILAAVELVADGAPWVIPYRLNGGYYNLSQHATSTMLVHSDPADEIPEPTDPDDWEFKLNSWCGLLVLSHDAWVTAGGYDEEFIGWGFEDDAFRHVLDRRVGPHQRLDSYALHLWHETSEETRFGQPFMRQNQVRARDYQHGIRP